MGRAARGRPHKRKQHHHDLKGKEEEKEEEEEEEEWLRTCFLVGLWCSIASRSVVVVASAPANRKQRLPSSSFLTAFYAPHWLHTARHAHQCPHDVLVYTQHPQIPAEPPSFYCAAPCLPSPCFSSSSSSPPPPSLFLPSPTNHTPTAMASDGGNADTYAYEEEQERKALLQSLHGPMKTWFHGGEASR